MGNCIYRDLDFSNDIRKLETNETEIKTKRKEIREFNNKIMIEEKEDIDVKQRYNKLLNEYEELKKKIHDEKNDLHNMQENTKLFYENLKMDNIHKHQIKMKQLETQLQSELDDINLSLKEIDMCLTSKAATLEKTRQEMLQEINETNDVKEQLKNAKLKLNELVDNSNKLRFSIKSYLKELLIKFFEHKNEFDNRTDISGNYIEKISSVENIIHSEIKNTLKNNEDEDLYNSV